MNTIRKLVINGREFVVSDTLIVTITGSRSDYTSAEIYAHVQAGGTAVLCVDGVYYALKNCESGKASFAGLDTGNGLDTVLWEIDDTALAEHFNYRHVVTPTTANVGQAIVVKEADSNGKPTAWECVDFPSGDGISNTEKTLMLTLFRNAAYISADMAATLAQLETLWNASGEDIPDVPDVPDVPTVTKYTITRELVNITSNNSASSVAENASYTATLTADDGYTLDSVVVTMGGVDVTADVYANGVISIPAVTGNVEIVASAVLVEETTAELVTDGLQGYWDLRNPEEVVAKDWHWAWPSNEGNGGMYLSDVGGSKGNKELPTFNEYGAVNSFKLMRDAETYPADVDFGTEFTFIILTHGAAATAGAASYANGIVGTNVAPRWQFGTNYYKTDGSTATTGTKGSGNMDSDADYNFIAKRVSGAEMKVIMDTSEYIFNGADYESFDHWNPNVFIGTQYSKGTTVAVAFYNRALTDVEIEEVRAFMKTLEVA